MLRHLRFLLACSSVILATQTPVAAEIVGFWRFEDGAFLADSSGNGHTLMASGDVGQSADVCDGSGAALAADVVQVWRNGAKVGTEVYNSLAGGSFGNYTMYIGTRGNTANWLNGMIDELKIEGIPEPECFGAL